MFIVEYAGPIIFHTLFPRIRPYIYLFWPYVYRNEVETPLSQVQWLLSALFILHFLKRELETIFVHKFSANTMPLSNIYRNSVFYWSLAGLLSGWHIYAPGSFADRNGLEPLDYFGLGLYVFGELCNLNVHLHLAQLRSRGRHGERHPELLRKWHCHVSQLHVRGYRLARCYFDQPQLGRCDLHRCWNVLYEGLVKRQGEGSPGSVWRQVQT